MTREEEEEDGLDLYGQRFELVQFRSLQDGSEGHDGGVSVPPVGAFDVFFDEGQDVRNHVVLAAGGQQHQTHPCRLTGVPVVVVVVLVLKRQVGARETPHSSCLNCGHAPRCFRYRTAPWIADGSRVTCLVRVWVRMGTRYCRAPLA